MRPAKFEYFRPATLSEAVSLLAESDGSGRVIAGGQSLMPAMNLRLAKPTRLVDIGKLPGLNRIEIGTERIKIGPLVRHAQIIADEALYSRVPLFRQAGQHIAHHTIREHGTIGGSVALADPAAEWATVLSLLDARICATNPQGERWISAREFFVSYYTTTLTENEIISSIEVPLPAAGTRFGFAEFSRQLGAFALAMVAVSLKVNMGGDIQDAGAWIGGCASRPLQVDMSALRGKQPSDSALDAVFNATNVEPSSDIHASGEDRVDIARTLFKRCVMDTYATQKG